MFFPLFFTMFRQSQDAWRRREAGRRGEEGGGGGRLQLKVIAMRCNAIPMQCDCNATHFFLRGRCGQNLLLLLDKHDSQHKNDGNVLHEKTHRAPTRPLGTTTTTTTTTDTTT